MLSVTSVTHGESDPSESAPSAGGSTCSSKSAVRSRYGTAPSLATAKLRNADLLQASLRNASLRDARLHNANLEDADLLATDLFAAELPGANLRNADLRSAKLEDANIWTAASTAPRSTTRHVGRVLLEVEGAAGGPAADGVPYAHAGGEGDARAPVRARRAPRGRRGQRQRLTDLARLLAAGAMVGRAPPATPTAPEPGKPPAASPDGTKRQIALTPGTLTMPGGIAVAKDGLYVTQQRRGAGRRADAAHPGRDDAIWDPALRVLDTGCGSHRQQLGRGRVQVEVGPRWVGVIAVDTGINGHQSSDEPQVG